MKILQQLKEDMQLVEADNGVVYIRSSALPCPHGFSTRLGGVSELPATKSLNLGRDRGDSEQTVLENLRRFGEAVGFDPATLVGVRQSHTADVMTVTAADAGLGYTRPADFTLDGYVTRERGVTIGIRTADCVPLLAAAVNSDGQAYVIGAFHAGWRGTVGGIAQNGIRKMIDLGADVRDIRVAMGAAIRKECFDIHEKEYAIYLERQGEDRVRRTVTPDPENPGTFYSDLFALNREILLDAGVLPEHVTACELCTACHPELFYSHRLTGYERGLMLSAIRLG